MLHDPYRPTDIVVPELEIDAEHPRLPKRFHRYHNVHFLKAGGQGDVYLAEDTVGKLRTVAIKIPNKLNEGAVTGFLAEALTSMQMHHPNVAKVLESGMINGRLPYLTTSYLSRGTLADLLQRQPKRPWKEAVRIVRQIAGAAQYVSEHRRLVHCDIKPQNILLDDKGVPYLTDFGVVTPASREATDATIGGTVAYMSPEQLSGGTPDPRWDVWALGVVLYQMLTGSRPFDGSHLLAQIDGEEPIAPRAIDRHIPAELEQVVLKCLSKDPQARYGSPIAVSEALRRIEAAQRRPMAAAVVGLVLLVAGLTWFLRPPQPASTRTTASEHRPAKNLVIGGAPPRARLPARLAELPSAHVLELAYFANPPAAPAIEMAPRLQFDVLALRKGEPRFRSVSNGGELSSRTDDYIILARALSPGYLYIFQIDSSGQQTWLFPRNESSEYSSGANPLVKDQVLQVPDGKALYLDDTSGTEHVYAVFSETRWPELERALAAETVRGAPREAIRIDEPNGLEMRGVGGTRPIGGDGAQPASPAIPASVEGHHYDLTLASGPLQAEGPVLVIERWFRHVDSQQP